MIVCANPKAQYVAYKDEIDSAIAAVLDRGYYILGDEVSAFEQEFASFIGGACAIGVGSGTEALHLALTACGIGSGDEVITVSHTAVATVAAIILAGAKPVFVDIESDYFTIDPEKIERAMTAKTKAIVPVHIYGQAALMKDILAVAQKHHLRVIEDCAQAHGAFCRNLQADDGGCGPYKRCGAYGDMGCFSFYPTKNLGAIGDGGMIVTGNLELAEKVRQLRQYGWKERYVSESFGWNSRLDELQAAILRVKLRHLDEDNGKRLQIAETYNSGLAETDCIVPSRRPGDGHVYHLYVVKCHERNELLSYLKAEGIMAAIHYPTPVHLQQAFNQSLDMQRHELSRTEKAATEILSLPMYPELRMAEVSAVIDAVKRFFRS